MNPAYLLDTNILAEPLRPAPAPAVMERLREFDEQLAVSAVTWHEMWFGCYRLADSPRRRAIEMYLTEVVIASMPILTYDERAAEFHAAERARLVRIGRTPSFADGQIAAIAYAHNLTLVTFNLADFIDFQGIRLADWSS